MTTATIPADLHQLLDTLTPPCQVADPDHGCPEPGQWIVRYTCRCPEAGVIVTCDRHRKRLERRIDLVCTCCQVRPVITSSESVR